MRVRHVVSVLGMAAIFCGTAQAQTYGSTAIVAKSGGDFTNPLDAVNAIGTANSWCSAPSASNPCLVKIMPGVYDLGGSNLNINNDHVYVLGSGQGSTELTNTRVLFNLFIQDMVLGDMSITVGGNVDSMVKMGGGALRNLELNMESSGTKTAVLVSNAAQGVEIENVSINGSGFGGFTGIHSINSSVLSIDNLQVNIAPTVQVYGSSCLGVNFATGSQATLANSQINCLNARDQNNSVRVNEADVAMQNVTVNAKGTAATGVFARQFFDRELTMDNVVVNSSGTSDSYALKTNGDANSSITVRNSSLIGDTAAIKSEGSVNTQVMNSHLNGGTEVVGGTLECASVTDENLDTFFGTCP